MDPKPVVAVLCDHQCHSQGELDYSSVSQRLLQNKSVAEVVILAKACQNQAEKDFSAFEGKKILFAGCPFLEESGFYEEIARKSGCKETQFYAVDTKTSIFDTYAGADSIEENLYRKIASLANILACKEPFEDEAVKPNQRVLVYGSGFSGLSAALKLAGENISVDVVHTPEDSLSPGSLWESLHTPGLISKLREEAQKADGITFIPSESLKQVTPIEGGFYFRTDSGEDREYGTVVFAPERKEEPSGLTGALNLSQVYQKIGAEESLKGEIVFLLDYKKETKPEIFRDVLLAAKYMREIFNAEVRILLRNVRVSMQDVQQLYDGCREGGIIFIKYEDDPVVKDSQGDLKLGVFDSLTASHLIIENPGWFIHPGTTGFSRAAREFADSLNLRVLANEYSQPDSLWLLPNETNRAGVFAIGAARGNMDASAIQEDAESLAFSVVSRISSGGLQIEEHIPEIDEDKCAYCLTCVRVCPFGAMGKNTADRVAKVIKSACQGCGICAAECPAVAIQMRNLSDESITSAIKALVLEE